MIKSILKFFFVFNCILFLLLNHFQYKIPSNLDSFYNNNFLSSLNSLDPRHWVFLINQSDQNLEKNLKNLIFLSSNNENYKNLAKFYVLKSQNKLKFSYADLL